MCEIDWHAVAEISKSMLTPAIGIVAAITGIATVAIARQQKIINEQKLAFDKYDRRMKVYEDVVHFIRTITKTEEFSDGILLQYENTISQAHFLFNPKIIEYLEEVNSHSKILKYWSSLFETTSKGHIVEGHDDAEVCTGLNYERKWLDAQLDIVKQKFKDEGDLYIGG